MKTIKKTLSAIIIMLLTTFITGSLFTSCTKEENIIETPANITVHLYIADSVNVSRYVVSQKGSGDSATSMKVTKAAFMTRSASGSSTATSFVPAAMPTSFTAYFIAAGDEDGYKKGALISKQTVNSGDNSITLPNIAYHVYVTNYTPNTDYTVNNTTDVESGVSGIESNFPTGTTTLYLWGELKNSTVFTSGKVTVDMTNPYAAIAIFKNNFVTGASYNGYNNATGGQKTYGADDYWYYLYIIPKIDSQTKAETGTNTAVSLQNIAGKTKSFNLYDNTITADNIYQYTITDNKSGCGLNINIGTFKGTYSYTLNGGDDSGTYSNPVKTSNGN